MACRMASRESEPSPLPVVRRWNAAYYHDDDRRWLKGLLILTNKSILFKEQTADKVPLAIDFSSITDVKVERALLGYNMLIVLVGESKFYFSSLSSSLGVKQVVLHFVKESLLSSKRKGCLRLSSDEMRSTVGYELLSIATESRQTLSMAASQLTTQGEQLDCALRTTHAIQRDLDIGSSHITYLESWLGHWNVSSVDLAPQIRHVQSTSLKESDEREFAVLYKVKESAEEAGTLIVSTQEICVEDQKKRVAFALSLRDVSSINVLTPWSLVITRRSMGQSDIRCHVTSAKVLSILKVLELVVKNKIEYEAPEDILFTSVDHSTKKLPERRTQLLGVSSLHNAGSWTSEKPSEEPNNAMKEHQVQLTSQAEVVTESEADELCSVLSDLKSLALGVGRELDVQDEKISELTDTVVNLTTGVAQNNRRMQKLL